jgi:hypothetical protein
MSRKGIICLKAVFSDLELPWPRNQQEYIIVFLKPDLFEPYWWAPLHHVQSDPLGTILIFVNGIISTFFL